jgi:hypothetical protein
MVYYPAFVLELKCDSAITITLVIVVEYTSYGIHKVSIFRIRINSFFPIVVNRSGKARQ